jgi:single-strand DNA-binding protein
MSINKVILEGRISKMGELKTSQAGVESIKFTVAVDRYTKDKESSADFIPCTAFRQTAKFVSSYFQKGKPIVVEGKITTGSYEKDGKTVYTTEVTADTVNFVVGDKKSDGNATQTAQAKVETTPTTPIESARESDIPF